MSLSKGEMYELMDSGMHNDTYQDKQERAEEIAAFNALPESERRRLAQIERMGESLADMEQAYFEIGGFVKFGGRYPEQEPLWQGLAQVRQGIDTIKAFLREYK